MIQSTPNNKAEKDHPDNVSLAGDGFDVVIKAKKALDAIPSCRNKVSCADILALATRDVVVAVSYIKSFINLKETIDKTFSLIITNKMHKCTRYIKSSFLDVI